MMSDMASARKDRFLMRTHPEVLDISMVVETPLIQGIESIASTAYTDDEDAWSRTLTEEDQQLTVDEVVLWLQGKYGRRYSRTTILAWISKGRRGPEGNVRFLKSTQFGVGSAHQIAQSDLENFVKFLTGEC